MRRYIIDLLKQLFSDDRNKELLPYMYGLTHIDYNSHHSVKVILMNLFILSDVQLVDFYTWCIINKKS